MDPCDSCKVTLVTSENMIKTFKDRLVGYFSCALTFGGYVLVVLGKRG